MTLWRWEQQGLVAPDDVINGRKYYDESKHPKRFDHDVTKTGAAQMAAAEKRRLEEAEK